MNLGGYRALLPRNPFIPRLWIKLSQQRRLNDKAVKE
jgi:hypothetical protein